VAVVAGEKAVRFAGFSVRAHTVSRGLESPRNVVRQCSEMVRRGRYRVRKKDATKVESPLSAANPNFAKSQVSDFIFGVKK
jgi:hypothetical protein